MGLRNTLLGALVAVSAFAAATEADAFWGSRGELGFLRRQLGQRRQLRQQRKLGFLGQLRSSGSSGGSWGSSGGSWGSRGSHGGFFSRHWARRHGSSGGSWGSTGGSYGSSGSNGSSGSYGSSGSAGGHASYSYEAPVEEVAPAEAEAVQTTLKLNVPADAKVTLAGIPTKQTGEMREFATGKLAAGQTWSNYNVHVEVTRDGKTYSQDRTILLTGGQSQDLSFDLGGMQLASKN